MRRENSAEEATASRLWLIMDVRIWVSRLHYSRNDTIRRSARDRGYLIFALQQIHKPCCRRRGGGGHPIRKNAEEISSLIRDDIQETAPKMPSIQILGTLRGIQTFKHRKSVVSALETQEQHFGYRLRMSRALQPCGDVPDYLALRSFVTFGFLHLW